MMKEINDNGIYANVNILMEMRMKGFVAEMERNWSDLVRR
jgi:hypothetical protein